MRPALVAHDANVIRGAIGRALGTHGFEIHNASDQNSMLALHAKVNPVLLVVGGNLLPFGIRAAILAVRGFDSGESKIIAVSPEVDTASAKELRDVGANEVILGGYSLDKLNAKLRVLGLY